MATAIEPAVPGADAPDAAADAEPNGPAPEATAESDTTRFLAPAPLAEEEQGERGGWSSTFFSALRPFMMPIANDADAASPPTRQRQLRAMDESDVHWMVRESVNHCPICEVELGTQHKNVTKRHCRHCGGVFCYTCTYDKVTLRHHPPDAWFPCTTKLSEMHVCSRCYDLAPPPADGLRRCRICHQKVRLAVFDAHLSLCTDEFQGRSALAPKQWAHVQARRRQLRESAAGTAGSTDEPSSAGAGSSSGAGPSDAALPGEPSSAVTSGLVDEAAPSATPRAGEAAAEDDPSKLPECMLCIVCMSNEVPARTRHHPPPPSLRLALETSPPRHSWSPAPSRTIPHHPTPSCTIPH